MTGAVQQVNDGRLSRASFSSGSVMRQLGVLFSFETTLVLFLYAGVYKEDPRFSWIPGDLTALAFGLSFLAGLFVVFRRGITLRREAITLLGLVAVFLMWALLSFLWTPSISYSLRKIGLLSTLTLWPLVAFALIVSQDRTRVRRFFVVLGLFSLWIAAETAVALLLASSQGIRGFVSTSLSTNYLGLGRVIGPGMLVLVTYQVYFLRTRFLQLLGWLAIATYTVLMLSLGSRGPFLAMLIASLFIVFVNFRWGSNLRQITVKLLLLMFMFTAFAGVVWYFSTSGAELPHTLERLEQAREQGFSGTTRFGGYATTWQMLDESPVWGHGIGSWPVLTGRGDIRAYPHNIFLEVFFELGIIGMLLFSAILIYAWRLLPPVATLRREPWMMLVAAQLLSAFLNANLSGDLNDNKLFWAFLGMMVVCALPERDSGQGRLRT